MRCPACQCTDTRVIDSRTTGESTRRRRECNPCGHRFTTHERIEHRLPIVTKKDGSREPYSREKVLHGIALACRKRPIDPTAMDGIADTVEGALEELRTTEVTTKQVGQAVLDALRGVDDVAYVRFASVYQAFESVEHFVDLIRPLREGV
jgi:transcriptional repressor NrdR